MNLPEFRAQFDPILLSDIRKRIADLADIANDSTLNQYLETVLPFINSGKRIRPYIAALIYSDFEGNDWQDIMPQLIAIEYFHTFALVHDDIMDRSDTRRGIPTIHHGVKNKLQTEIDNTHTSYSQAIIIGDLLETFSHESFSENIDKQNIRKAFSIFTLMAQEVMIGQMLDVDLVNRSANEVTSELINKKMLLKTASYTFTYPMKIGAALSEKTNDEFLTKFGTAIGIAFQIKDDILDITGTEEEIGKTPLCDVKEGQKTLLTNFIFKQDNENYKNDLLKYLGKDFSVEDHNTIRKIFIESGAIKHAESIAIENLNIARELLKTSEFIPKIQIELSNLIDKLEIRKS